MPNPNAPGSTYLPEDQLQARAAEHGWMLSEPGQQPEINVMYVSKPRSASA